MTRTEIIDFAQFGLSVNDSQLNDSIDPARWIQLVQMAYKNVWIRARNKVARSQLLAAVDSTWPAGSATFTLPTTPVNLQQALIYDILFLDDSGNPYDRFGGYFETRNVLRIYPGAVPSAAAFNMRFYIIPEAEVLDAGTSPLLIKDAHHEVIAWECLKTVKMLADKEVPQKWEEKLEDLEFHLFSELKSRPIVNRPNIISMDAPMARPSS